MPDDPRTGAGEFWDSQMRRAIQKKQAQGNDSLLDWIKARNPQHNWDYKHAALIAEYIDAQDRGEIQNLMILTAPQHLKALDINTPIPTPNGFVRIECIEQGDEVFDRDGNAVRVTEVSPIYVGRECFQITFDDGDAVIADGDHRWLARNRVGRRRPSSGHSSGHCGNEQVVTTRQMILNLKVEKNTVKKGKVGRCNWSIDFPAPVDRPDVGLPVPPYTLGAWLGDGTSATASITCADEEVLEAIRAEGVEVRTGRESNSGRALLYPLGRKGVKSLDPSRQNPFLEGLRFLGLIGNKHVPDTYLLASRSQRMALLQGLMDTDGQIHAQDAVASFVNTNERLALGVLALARSLGIKATISSRIPHLRGKPCSRAYFVKFTTDQPVFKLTRKLERIRLDRRPDTKRRFIVSIEPVPTRPVKCIAVDSPTRTYLCGRGFIPTHNTTIVSVNGTVCTLDKKPETRVILCSYNNDRAAEVSILARRLAREAGLLSTERKGVGHWETYAGGGVLAVGTGAGVTGNPADLIVVDDPIKGREESESALEREKAWSWYTNDLLTRRQKHTRIRWVYTPWHSDDLGQRALKYADTGTWTVLKLPAIAEEDDPIGREIGEALCPELHDLAYLESMRRQMGDYAFSALYQCRPSPKSGGAFQPDRIRIVSAPPAQILQTVRGWDFGATSKGDWTRGVKICRDEDGSFGILHLQSVRAEPAERDDVLRHTTQDDGISVTMVGPEDPGAAGKGQVLAHAKLLAGYTCKFVRVSGSKEQRSSPFGAQLNHGNVWMLTDGGDLAGGEIPWNKAILAELEQFPYGTHDDITDALASAFAELDLAPTLRFPRFSESIHCFDWSQFEDRFGGYGWNELLHLEGMFKFSVAMRYGTSELSPTLAILTARDTNGDIWVLSETVLDGPNDEQTPYLAAQVKDLGVERVYAPLELTGTERKAPSAGTGRWWRLRDYGLRTVPQAVDYREAWGTLDELLRVRPNGQGPRLRVHEDCVGTVRFFRTAQREIKDPEDVATSTARAAGEVLALALHRFLPTPAHVNRSPAPKQRTVA